MLVIEKTLEPSRNLVGRVREEEFKGKQRPLLLHFHHVGYSRNTTVTGSRHSGHQRFTKKKKKKDQQNKDRERRTRRNGEEWSRGYKHKRHGNT